jgi:hypothetical protein
MQGRIAVAGILCLVSGLLFAQKMTVKDADANVLMEVNDEGLVGSITVPSGSAPSTTAYKLYNVGGSLYWNGAALGMSVSAGGWTDDGTMVRLTTSTDNVGIGDDTPTYKLDVEGKIGISDVQIVYSAHHAGFEGTLVIGNGGGSLNHSTMADGYYNTAIGFDAFYSNTTGYANTASGNKALYTNGSGSFNVAAGTQSLYSNSTGGYNAATGFSALFSNTTGNGNTALGALADVSSNNLMNATAIGYNTKVDASNKVRIGNTAITVIEGQVAWSYPSDSTKKENLLRMDGEKVLGKIRGFWLGSWNFKGKDNQRFRHYGPMAQAFYRAFGHDGVGKVGTDTTICSSDLEGINMIAIQALEKRTAEQSFQIAELKKTNEQVLMENETLKAELAQLKDVVTNFCENMGKSKISLTSVDRLDK